MKEIEAKAWLKGIKHQEVKIFLHTYATFIKNTHKEDQMYAFHGTDLNDLFRIRNEEGTTIITQKEKHITPEGMEMNDEHEFCVKEPDAFKNFMSSKGYSLAYQKTKTVQQYRFENLLVEIVDIEGLGSFLEVESLVEDEEQAISAITLFFARFSMENEIEPRPYGVLLTSVE